MARSVSYCEANGEVSFVTPEVRWRSLAGFSPVKAVDSAVRLWRDDLEDLRTVDPA